MDIDTSVNAQVQSLLRFLQSPLGISVLVVFLAAAIAAIVVPRMRWVLLTFLLWSGTFGYVGALYQRVNVLIFPLNDIRAQSRTLVIGLTAALIIPALVAPRGWRMRLISPVALLFLAFELLFCVRETLNGDMERGPISIIVFMITFIVFCIGLPRWMQSVDDIHNVVRTVAWAAGFFCLCTFAQTIVNSGAIVLGGRMHGTMGNPQSAALILGCGLAPLCYMVAKPDQGIFQRIMYGSLAALNAIFLAWTGSRTGVFVATLGLAITFRYRLHRLVILGAFTFAFLLLIVSNFVPASWFNEHLVSTEDTRSAVWYGQLDQFVSHPLTGTLASGEEFGYGENSYLAAAARYGIIGIIPLMLAVGLCVVEVIRLNANKRYLRKDAMLVDLVTGCVVALGVGAWFEGYLLASFSFPTYCLLANFAMITALRDLATLHYNQSMGYIPSEETDEMYAPEPAYADYALDG